MRPHVYHGGLIVLLGCCCLAAAGCSNPARQRMIGDWEATYTIDDEDLAKIMPSESGHALTYAKALMKTASADIHWEIAADETVTIAARLLGAEKRRTGTWRFLRADEDSTTLEIHFDEVDPVEVEFTFADPDTFVVAPIGLANFQLTREIRFKRVRPAA